MTTAKACWPVTRIVRTVCRGFESRLFLEAAVQKTVQKPDRCVLVRFCVSVGANVKRFEPAFSVGKGFKEIDIYLCLSLFI